jgi:hypothetical protein
MKAECKRTFVELPRTKGDLSTLTLPLDLCRISKDIME